MGKIKVHGNPPSYSGMPFHFCPGCHYGMIVRAFLEALEELELQGETILVTGIGCSMPIARFTTKLDAFVALHGRAPAVATGIKRAHYGKRIVITMQGDGDLAAIGMGEIINAAARSEKLTTIFLNNANFGTTGGQMAPTTLLDQVTPTSPEGRDSNQTGFPIHMAELMAQMKGVAYSFRGAVTKPKYVNQTKKAIKTALQKQVDNVGYSFVEILSACPPNHHITPPESLKYVEEKMMAEYPLGEFKNVDKVE